MRQTVEAVFTMIRAPLYDQQGYCPSKQETDLQPLAPTPPKGRDRSETISPFPKVSGQKFELTLTDRRYAKIIECQRSRYSFCYN